MRKRSRPKDHPAFEMLTAPDEGEPICRRDVAVLHADDDLLVVDKPAEVWLDDAPEDEPAVNAQLAALGLVNPAAPPPVAVLPLDFGASGICVLARKPEGLTALRGQMSQGAMEVGHLVLVRGRADALSGKIGRRLLERDGGLPTQLADADQGVAAVTMWRLRDNFVGFALLECIPRTAVRQQLRAHLFSMGLTLAVDTVFGSADRLMLSSFKANYHQSRRHPERPLIRRLSIHAQWVSLTHPATADALKIECPPPKDFRATLNQLGKYGRLPPT